MNSILIRAFFAIHRSVAIEKIIRENIEKEKETFLKIKVIKKNLPAELVEPTKILLLIKNARPLQLQILLPIERLLNQKKIEEKESQNQFITY